ncbi:MAG: hypothetical protein GXO75_08270 [Calditrichaeota bacterium]|nr:hypothetical protein [Calditrichota bacterium]
MTDQEKNQEHQEQNEDREIFELTPEDLDSLEEELEKEVQAEQGSDTGTQDEEAAKSQETDTGEGEKGESGDEGGEKSQEKGEERTEQASKEKEVEDEAEKWRQKAEELEKKLLELEGKKFEDFEELTDEEFEILKEEDPEAAFQYLREKEEYERWKQLQEEKKQMEEEAQIQQAQKQTWENIVEFAKSVGYDPESDAENFQKFLQSEEFRKLDQFVTENFLPRNGVYTKEQMEMAWKALNFEKLAAQERINGRQEAVEDISKAGQGGSRFDRASRTDAGREKEKFANWTARDIMNATEEEIAQYEKWLEEQGL